MNEDYLNYPSEFNKDLFEKICRAIDRSESITLFSPPGMGKTLTLQLLHYRKLAKYYIDLNSFREEKFDTSGKTVIIFDHAENLAKPEFAKQALLLRAMRDSGRDHISYIFGVSGNAIIDFDSFGPLKTLLLENLITFGPLKLNDAKIFLKKSEQIYKGKLTTSQKNKILTLSGGVPRLIKRLCKLYLDKMDIVTDLKLQSDLEEIGKFLVTNPQPEWHVPLLSPKTSVADQIGNITFTIPLSRQEYDLAKLLIEKSGNLVSREEMIEAVWKNMQYEVNDHALDQMLHRLRTKLAAATPKCQLTTFRGRGCKLVM